MGLGTKILGSVILNFGPCATKGHLELREMIHRERERPYFYLKQASLK